jgi:hypothetical protein
MIHRLRCALFLGALAITAHVAAQTTSPPKPSKDADITCPYLRQQRIDRHACQLADPEIGRDVIDNLKRLRRADSLLEMAKDLARDGFLLEAIECCTRAAELCPGSPCAERAANTMHELALGVDAPIGVAEESTQSPRHDPDVEAIVGELMKVCHLLMNQGMQHEAAELARQAYALDPQRVEADPLVYKMHLHAESPASQPAGASEASEPLSCPYCPSGGKPIREVVPEKTPPAVNYEFEAGVNTGGLHLCADCSLSGNVYHVRYKDGSLKIWKTPDAAKTKP